MLQRSIRSLMTLSPDVYVGLLNLNTAESQISDFIRSLPNPHMVRVRDVTVHFPNWNPTQVSTGSHLIFISFSHRMITGTCFSASNRHFSFILNHFF